MASHQNTAKDIHRLDKEPQETIPALLDGQEYRLDVILAEDARHVLLADLLGLLVHGVLVREDGARAAEG